MTKKLTIMVLLSLVTLSSWAQTLVGGTVVSATDGEPIIGASVKVVGTKYATVTDVNGAFSFNSQVQGKKLEISAQVKSSVDEVPPPLAKYYADTIQKWIFFSTFAP